MPAIALDQAVPFGRVYSFPTELKCLNAAKPEDSSIFPGYQIHRGNEIIGRKMYASDVEGSVFIPIRAPYVFPSYDPRAILNWERNVTFTESQIFLDRSKRLQHKG